MSVELTSRNQNVVEGISNGGWKAIVCHARVFHEEIPDWNGYHDGQSWSSEDLNKIADSLEQSAKWIPILREMANDGGVSLS
jgi:predicted alpha/beta-fold hydrolase